MSLMKLQELIIFIASKCKDDEEFHSVKLNKILFFSDFISFGRYHTSITGAKYIHKPLGPVPSEMIPARDRLLRTDSIRLVETGRRKTVVATRNPQLDLFLAREIDITWSVINWLSEKTEHECSELTHAWHGYEMTGDDEHIPYGFALFEPRTPTADDRKRALLRANELAS